MKHYFPFLPEEYDYFHVFSRADELNEIMDSLIINCVMAYIGETNTTTFTLLNNMVKNGNSCIQ